MGEILLTPEEMADVIKKLKIVEPIWDSKKRKWVHGEEWQKHDAIAKAQLKKVRGKIAVVEIPMSKSAGYNVDGKPYIALAMLEADWQALLEESEDRKE